ncbi:multidrug resistance protein [Pseudomonas amygdali pv. mori str. 301020]|nr:multidrug resistance protein [Pseudomonas amygdali pv. mori str. 301020]
MGVITIDTQSITLTRELPGRTAPYLISEVRPQVGGLIQSRNFVEGAEVKAGQLLYQIDPASYSASYDSARAALAKAEASLVSTRLKAQRYLKLVSASAISRQEADDAQAALGEARADVLAAKASVESARIELADTQIIAPISGRIGKSSVTAGALVTADQADVLTTIQQLDPIYVDVTQSSASLLKLRQAMARGELETVGGGAAKVQLVLEDGSVYSMEGRLEFADVTVDQGTRSITLRALFPNPKAELLPGMYVRAIVQEGIREHGVLVPQQAVTRDNAGKPIAYVVGSDNKLQLRKLQIERTVGNQWLVQSGLEPGDSLVVEGMSRVREGLEVTATPWQPAPRSESGGSASSRQIF